MGATNLVSLQGKVWMAERLSTGKPGAMVWLGNVPTFQLKMTSTTVDKTEAFSGLRNQYDQLITAKKAELSLTLDEWTAGNLAAALWATQMDVTTGSVTGESVTDDLVAGDYFKLDNPHISSLALTDSAATPVTVDSSKYSIESATAGLIKMLDVASYTQPFKAAYSHAARQSFTMFTEAPPERYLVLDGIDTVNNVPVIVQLYRCKFQPVSSMDLIHSEYGNLQLTGSALYDSTNAANSDMGGFGRIDLKEAS